VPAAAADSRPRIVVDEASFDFREMADAEVEDALEELDDALQALCAKGQTPAVFSQGIFVDCREGVELYDVLFENATSVDRDVLQRTMALLERCPEWDEHAPAGCEPLELPDAPIDAYSAGFAFAMALEEQSVACLVAPCCSRRGFQTLYRRSQHADVLFFAEAAEARRVWRHEFALEHIAELDFFTVAEFAFPSLVFHPDLRFGKFDGSYSDLRSPVVKILGALDDHFAHVLVQRNGLPHDVAAGMGKYGVDLSPESPNTRASNALMRLRDVTYDGATYHCEWHAKIERHRNRIHFTLPSQGPGGRILIGIFAEHLDT
jgi:hypothetical protein